MRVAHITTVDLSLRYLIWAQLRGSVEAGDDVIAISAPGPYVTEVEQAGIRHIPLRSSTRGMNALADIRSAVELWRILRRERPDVLHTHNPKPGVYGRIVGRLARVPIVVNTQHGLYATEDDSRAKRAAVYALEALAGRCSDAELVQNPEDLELLRRLHLVRPSRARLLGNGVDLTRFDRARVDRARVGTHVRAAIRSELHVRDDQIVVGIVGRLVAEKGYPELFEAMRELGDEYVLAAVGPIDAEKPDALPASVREAAERDGVRFLGMRTDVDALYRGMDLFALPSHREGFPRAAMEAAAMGLPLVVTDVRGCREVVDDGVNGFLVPVRDASSLAKAIRRLGEDPVLRGQMGAESARIARDRFDEQQVVRIVLDTYTDLAARKGRRAPTPRPRRRYAARAAKRAIDVTVAGTALVLLSPVLAAIALAVRANLGAPVLFRQERPGRGGRVFTIFKFRTMRDAVAAGGEPLPDAQRLTRLGRFLRATSLDELPELWNVVRGDMSLVGPRPLLVEYLPRYNEQQRRRHEVRPGITGWAQVNGRNDQTWEQRFDLDVWYVENWSVGLDARVLARTVATVVRGEGIAEPGHATKANFEGAP